MIDTLAIIIPYYRLTYLKETLISLKAQTDQRFNVYIGNDASPENPEKLLKEFEGSFKFIYKKFEKNIGSISLTKQWDRCIAMMKDEEWFMILGDDDCLSENVVYEFYENLQLIKNENNIIRFASRIINGRSENISDIFLNPRYEDAISSYCRKLQGKTRSSLSEFIFRKESFDRFGFKNYYLAWTSDDRAIIDVADCKNIYSINTVVFVRNSDINISGGNNATQPKIKARLQSAMDLLSDYKYLLTFEQHVIIFGAYEGQFYLKRNPAIKYYLFLFRESLKLKGSKYFMIQLKSCLYKLVSRNS